jgi:hypothetical protein
LLDEPPELLLLPVVVVLVLLALGDGTVDVAGGELETEGSPETSSA